MAKHWLVGKQQLTDWLGANTSAMMAYAHLELATRSLLQNSRDGHQDGNVLMMHSASLEEHPFVQALGGPYALGQSLCAYALRGDGPSCEATEGLGMLLSGSSASAASVRQGFLDRHLAGFGEHERLLLPCFRQLLRLVRIPGEAQRIDRLIEAFAEVFVANGGKLDPEVDITSADCVHVMCFSLIMLSTDLHNPHITNKMTEDEFIRPNRGINGGHSLPDTVLQSFYRGTRSQSFVHLQETTERERARHSSRRAAGSCGIQ